MHYYSQEIDAFVNLFVVLQLLNGLTVKCEPICEDTVLEDNCTPETANCNDIFCTEGNCGTIVGLEAVNSIRASKCEFSEVS